MYFILFIISKGAVKSPKLKLTKLNGFVYLFSFHEFWFHIFRTSSIRKINIKNDYIFLINIMKVFFFLIILFAQKPIFSNIKLASTNFLNRGSIKFSFIFEIFNYLCLTFKVGTVEFSLAFLSNLKIFSFHLGCLKPLYLIWLLLWYIQSCHFSVWFIFVLTVLCSRLYFLFLIFLCWVLLKVLFQSLHWLNGYTYLTSSDFSRFIGYIINSSHSNFK